MQLCLSIAGVSSHCARHSAHGACSPQRDARSRFSMVLSWLSCDACVLARTHAHWPGSVADIVACLNRVSPADCTALSDDLLCSALCCFVQPSV